MSYSTNISSNLAKVKQTTLEELCDSTIKNFENFSPLLQQLPDREIGNLLKNRSVWNGRNCIVFALQNEQVEHANAIFQRLNEGQRQVLLSQRDSCGLSVTDYAAIFAKKTFYQTLKQVSKVEVLKKPYVNSPICVRKCLRVSKNCFLDEKCRIFLQKPGDMDDSLITGAELVHRYGNLFSIPPQHFGSLFYMSPEILKAYWVNRLQNSSEEDRIKLEKFFEMLRQNQKKGDALEPNLAIRQLTQDDQGKPLTGMGCGVFVRKEKISEGDVITLYGGEIEEDKGTIHNHGEYYLGLDKVNGRIFEANARNIRSLGSLAAHGFPNAYLTEIDNVSVLRAIEQISPSQPVVVSYGEVYFCKPDDVVIEVRYEAMKRFVQQHSLMAFRELIFENINRELSAQELGILIRWEYILAEEPVRFLQLLLRGDLHRSDLKNAEFLLDEFESVLLFAEQIPFAPLLPYAKKFHRKIPPQSGQICMELAKLYPNFAKDLADCLIYCMYSKSNFQTIVKTAAINRRDINPNHLESLLKQMDKTQ